MRLHSAIVAILVGAAPVAHAADAPPFAGPFEWSGFYLGAFGTYAIGTATGDVVQGTSDSFVIEGLQAGGLGGYNWNAGLAVVGLEADAAIGAIDGVGFGGGIDDLDVNPLGHVRVRVGLPIDRVLPFVAAGVTASGGHARSPGFGSFRQLHMGWNVGAGVDVALTEHVLIRAEYVHDRAPSNIYSFTPGDIDFSWRSNSFRFAAIWKL